MRRQLAQGLGGLALGATVAVASANAWAKPAPPRSECATPERATLSISTEGDVSNLLDRRALLQQISRELRTRGASVCEPDDSARATLQVKVGDGATVQLVLLSAQGDVLGQRSVELAAVPEDARPLALAVAADELVAESWAALRPPRPAPSKPAEKQPGAPAAKTATTSPTASPRAEIGPLFSYDRAAGGQRLLGVDVAGALLVAPSFALTLRGGIRQGLPTQAPHGSVRARAAGAQAGLRLTLVPDATLRLAWFARVGFSALSVSAFATGDATAFEQHAWCAAWTTGPELKLGLSRSLGVVLEGGVGSVLRPVHFTDTGEPVSSISGFAGSVSGGVYASF